MAITIDDIKALRQETGAGVMACRSALSEAEGDRERAKGILRAQGGAAAAKRADREVREGLIEAYVHGGRLGAMVELNCETDFVARTEIFQTLAHDLALQVASMDPLAVRPDDVPADSERPAAEAALLTQAFIKDPSKAVQDVINETIASIGERIEVRRFIRFQLGG